jgi:hypothetical protein
VFNSAAIFDGTAVCDDTFESQTVDEPVLLGSDIAGDDGVDIADDDGVDIADDDGVDRRVVSGRDIICDGGMGRQAASRDIAEDGGVDKGSEASWVACLQKINRLPLSKQ